MEVFTEEHVGKASGMQPAGRQGEKTLFSIRFRFGNKKEDTRKEAIYCISNLVSLEEKEISKTSEKHLRVNPNQEAGESQIPEPPQEKGDQSLV